jgi:hypothetical protein
VNESDVGSGVRSEKERAGSEMIGISASKGSGFSQR